MFNGVSWSLHLPHAGSWAVILVPVLTGSRDAAAMQRSPDGENSLRAAGTVGRDGQCSARVPYVLALCVDSHPQPNSITISVSLQAARRNYSWGQRSHDNCRLHRRLVVPWPLSDF